MFPQYPDLADPDKLNKPETPGFKALRYISDSGELMIDGDGVGSSTSEFIDANFISLSIHPAIAGNEWIHTGAGTVSNKKYGYYKYKFGYAEEKIEVHLYTPKNN